MQQHVLFVCEHNAGRSQLAEELFRMTVAERHLARSAGTNPATAIHPNVVRVLDEVGIDVRGKRPRELDSSDVHWAHIVVAMGCGEDLPFLPGKQYVDWQLQDPRDLELDEVREIRATVAAFVQELIQRLDPARPPRRVEAVTITPATCRTPITAPALANDDAVAIAEVFAALGDPARVKILHRLASVAPEGVCVCDLIEPLGLTQSAVSYHVRRLGHAGLIARDRRGRFNYYALREEALERVARLVGHDPLRRAS